MAAEVEGRVEVGAFLVHLVEDGGEGLIGTLFFGGNLLFGSAGEAIEGDGHAETVTLYNGFFALDLHYLTEGILTVDADDGTYGDGNVRQV